MHVPFIDLGFDVKIFDAGNLQQRVALFHGRGEAFPQVALDDDTVEWRLESRFGQAIAHELESRLRLIGQRQRDAHLGQAVGGAGLFGLALEAAEIGERGEFFEFELARRKLQHFVTGLHRVAGPHEYLLEVAVKRRSAERNVVALQDEIAFDPVWHAREEKHRQ